MKEFLIHCVGGLCMFYCGAIVLSDKYGFIAGVGFVTYLAWGLNRMMNPDED